MAGTNITIDVDDIQVKNALRQLSQRMSDLSPVMRSIGEMLLRTTRSRIEHGGPAPDGTPWAPLSPVTLARKKWDHKLVESGRLLGSMHPSAGSNYAQVGTNVVYAAAQQFGMRKGYAGRGKKRNFPIPWGDIPARPFLGLSSSDRASILDLVSDYLQRSTTD